MQIPALGIEVSAYDEFLGRFIDVLQSIPASSSKEAIWEIVKPWIDACPAEWRADFENDRATASALRKVGKNMTFEQFKRRYRT